jgi:hypothetical protein
LWVGCFQSTPAAVGNLTLCASQAQLRLPCIGRSRSANCSV